MAKIGENFPDVPRRRRAPRSKGLDAAVRTRTSVFPECAHNLRAAGPKCWHYYVIWRSCISYVIIQSFLNLFLQDLFSCIARTSFCFFAWYVAVLYFWMIRASVIHSAVLNACSTNALKIKIYYTIPVQRICFFKIFSCICMAIYAPAATTTVASPRLAFKAVVWGGSAYRRHNADGRSAVWAPSIGAA